MSFKRDGNDIDLLGTLRKRRVKELLSEDIPEDEAKLLSNGRFTCTVCSNNPIFDTVSMLSVHRHGKKHLHNLEIHEMKKRELKQLIIQRRQEQFLKDGTTSIHMAQQNHNDNGILTASPYNPRVKKKVKLGERKPTVDLEERTHINKHSSSIVLNQSATTARQSTGSSPFWQKTCEQQLSGPIKHDYQLKKIFSNKNEHPVRVAPYQSRQRESQPVSSGIDRYTKRDCFSASQCSSTNNMSKLLSGIPTPSSKHHSACQWLRNNKLAPVHSPQALEVPRVSSNSTVCRAMTKAQMILPEAQQKTIDFVGHPCQTVETANAPATSISQQKNPVVERLKQLQGSGWKRDWDGKWIKDENAEFDSDEEAPDIPFSLQK